MEKTLLMERVMDGERLALIEDGALCALYHRSPDSEDLTGNIYLGRVENLLPGMNAAFVDIGLEKKGFLSAGDIRLYAQGDAQLSKALAERRIGDLVRPGQEIPVQVVKSQTGGKGPRLSCHLTLPGRLLALLPGVRYVGVSRKIGGQDDRERLRAWGQRLLDAFGAGLILRTASLGAGFEAIEAEYRDLLTGHEALLRQAAHTVAPKLLRDENDLALMAVRDLLDGDVQAVWAEDEDCCERLRACARRLAPDLASRVRLHEGQVPLFDLYRVDAQADQALERRVWLKHGGFLVIDETEALTAVDVNTGKNTGGRCAEDTIIQTNREAAEEVMRQLRLRDIGGMIVVDFINMKREADRQALLDLLRGLAARDRNRTAVVDITPLGLVELTRKRAGESLRARLTHSCPHCSGSGAVPAHEATARRVVRDVWRRRRSGDSTPLIVEAAAGVCGWVRNIGTPPGGPVRLIASEGLEAGEYRLAPDDGKTLEQGERQ